MIDNQKKTLIVSHRLRGFNSHDASLQGLHTALAENVNHFEVDCRVTKDGEIVIHHDAILGGEFTEQAYIADKTFAELKNIHYKNFAGTILTLDELFQTIEPNKQVKLYLDIKESGKEEKIINEAAKRNLLGNMVIISWLPEVLFKVNSLIKSMQLCFSFYPICNSLSSRINYMQAKIYSFFNVNNNQRLTFLFDAYNNDNNISEKYGFDFEHFVSLPFAGKLLDMLQSVNGIICINYKMAEMNFIKSLKQQKVLVCLYSLNTEKDLQKYTIKYQPDIVLSDNSFLTKK